MTNDEVAPAIDYVVALVNERYVRFTRVADVPEGALAITPEVVEGMPSESLSDLYSRVAGVGPKKFKDRRVAIESIWYQVGKMPTFDPSAAKSPLAEAVLAGARANKATDPTRVKNSALLAATKARANNYELVPTQDPQVLEKLPPQAREIVLIMADLAREKGSTKFSGAELVAKLNVPEVAAKLRTIQDPARILAYYRGRLASVGLIKVT